jgi:hypothetical protein
MLTSSAAMNIPFLSSSPLLVSHLIHLLENDWGCPLPRHTLCISYLPPPSNRLPQNPVPLSRLGGHRHQPKLHATFVNASSRRLYS